ncbi:MAG: hypothetical protein J1F23_07870 [Oscillospiraceae bacterium]|nr:hypothetical protein [Oscillospiraceae bacterium]
MKYRSFKVALGGIIASLSIVLMLLTGIIPVLTYAVPAICGALLMMLVIELGSKFALSVYAAVAILSMLVVADKEAAVMYTAFFGYYPVLKGFFEKHLKNLPCWIMKYIVFNFTMIVSYFIVSRVFGITFSDMDSFGKFAMPVLLAAGNVVFALYDVALTRLVTAYLFRWQKHIKKLFK